VLLAEAISISIRGLVGGTIVMSSFVYFGVSHLIPLNLR